MSFSLVPSADETKADLQVSGVTVLSAYNDRRLVAAASPSVTDDSKRLATTAYIRDVVPGIDQTWQGVTRSSGTTYYNTTGKPITAMLWAGHAAVSTVTSVLIDGVDIIPYDFVVASNTRQYITFVIPPGSSYSYTLTEGSGYISMELR